MCGKEEGVCSWKGEAGRREESEQLGGERSKYSWEDGEVSSWEEGGVICWEE